jgi:hypothetical protein
VQAAVPSESSVMSGSGQTPKRTPRSSSMKAIHRTRGPATLARSRICRARTPGFGASVNLSFTTPGTGSMFSEAQYRVYRGAGRCDMRLGDERTQHVRSRPNVRKGRHQAVTVASKILGGTYGTAGAAFPDAAFFDAAGRPGVEAGMVIDHAEAAVRPARRSMRSRSAGSASWPERGTLRWTGSAGRRSSRCPGTGCGCRRSPRRRAVARRRCATGWPASPPNEPLQVQ